ncbi:MAG: prolyl oligopeptidase family serine peptidase, partial [Alphaproteobacteria bacterium]|nr:prolyl oligopeptidase family serine peptidase [Alphaproteobacteria bacterium]
PDAPYAIGYNAYKWFDIDGLESASVFERFDYLERLTKLAKQSLDIVDKTLEEISLTYGIDYKNISVVGFSQGALITLLEGLTTKKKIASLGACSSVPLILSDALKIGDILNTPPVFLSHGTADDIVPFIGLEMTVNTLKNLNISVTQHTVPGMGHGIDGTTLQALTEFLNRTLCQQ